MRIPNKLYDILKWIVLVCIPALSTAYVGLSAVYGWGYAEQVSKTAVIVCTLLGTLLGISTITYNKENYSEGGSEEDEESNG